MLSKARDLPGNGRFAPRRGQGKQFEFGAEVQVASQLALSERLVDRSVGGVSGLSTRTNRSPWCARVKNEALLFTECR